MSKNNVVKFPGIKINKHQTERNELLAAAQECEDYVQYMTDMIIDQMVMDGYDMEDKKLIDEIIYDPQTVGGLAFIVCKESKTEIFKVLKQHKIEYSVIGFVNNIKNKIKIEYSI